MKQIINHFTDQDLYTFSCMYYVLKNYPTAEVKYKFFDRNKEVYPKGFGEELQSQINNMVNIVCTDEELAFMMRKCYYLPQWFFTFLKGYRFNPNEVHIKQDEEGYLDIEIEGAWWSTIMWEMVLLATISEMSHILNGDIDKIKLGNEYYRALDKAEMFLANGLTVSDMGTRRRLSFDLQNEVVKAFTYASKTLAPNQGWEGKFVGTSNVYFAMKYDLTPIGTMSHQIIEAEEVMSGVFEANYQVMTKWNNTFNGYLGTYLYDCFGENAYFNNVNRQSLMMFDGIRVDSGDEIDQLLKHIAKYTEYGIDPSTKSIIFSNALNAEKAIKIHKEVNGRMRDSYGVGTYLCCNFDKTKNVDALPIKHKNIVIKLIAFRYSSKHNWHDCVKLSCDKGKTLGNPEKCAYLLNILNAA